MASKLLCCSLLVACAFLIHGSSGSAIPMWEYLSRGEKVNILADDDQNIISNRIKDKLATSGFCSATKCDKVLCVKRRRLACEEDLINGTHL